MEMYARLHEIGFKIYVDRSIPVDAIFAKDCGVIIINSEDVLARCKNQYIQILFEYFMRVSV